MNHAELINALQLALTNHCEAGTVPKVTISRVLNAFEDVLTTALAHKDEVSLPGVGKFTSGIRAARKGRNPSTGAEIDIPEKRVVKFSPSKILKDAIALELEM